MQMEPHNSYLQATIEFGWVGGLCLALANLLAVIPLFRLCGKSDSARFALCSLAYMTILSLAHGRTSRDMMLFAMMGFAVGVYDRA
jgi:O-antigen ligase